MLERESHVNDKFLNESMRSSYRGVNSHEKAKEGMVIPRDMNESYNESL